MSPTMPFSSQEIAALCVRAFPDRAGQTILEVKSVPSRQHEMVSFELWWMDEEQVLRHQDMIVRRYISTLSWWRPDDRGKAQREVSVCRWLKEMDFPVPDVYLREFGPRGDVVLFERLPSQELAIGGRPLREVVTPYIGPFAGLLAHLHSLPPPPEVQKVVPGVTLPGALANLMAVAYQIDLPDLRDAIERTMTRAYDVPETQPVLLHGDYHLLNALLYEGEVSAVVDWEYSAIGDPRWDVANAYMQLVDFGAAEAADQFLTTYMERSQREFEGPPIYNVVTPLQQWAISEWLVQQEAAGYLPGFALAQDLVALRDVHRRRAEMAMEYLDK